jgi:hypothetical protein
VHSRLTDDRGQRSRVTPRLKRHADIANNSS